MLITRIFLFYSLTFGVLDLAIAQCPDTEMLAEKYSYTLQQELSYCEGLNDQKVDIALPQGKGPFPAIIFIHGGAWSGGERGDYETELEKKDEKYNLLKGSAKRGFVAATIDYRITKNNGVQFPTHLNDVKCAVRWLKTNAEKFNVDPARIGLTGHSAGGHLSLLAGLTPDHLFRGENALFPEQTNEVKAIVSWAGPTDIVSLDTENPELSNLLKTVFGGSLPESKQSWLEASPITYLRPESPPIQIVHGAEDHTIPQSQALSFFSRAKEMGSHHELIVCQELGHGFEDPSGRTLKNDHELVAFAHMLRFFKAHLK